MHVAKTRPRLIAFCGPKGCGKDTAANYLLARNTVSPISHLPYFCRLNFADPLKQVVCLTFGLNEEEVYNPLLKEKVLDRWPHQTPRALLQDVANHFRRTYSQDIWVRSWQRNVNMHASKYLAIVCTDLRHTEELDELRLLGAKVFYIHNPDAEATRKKGIEDGNPLWTDTSEAFTPTLYRVADEVIDNSGSIDELQTKVGEAVQRHFGDFHTWSLIYN